MKLVSIVISNTNTRDVLRECLNNLYSLINVYKQNLEVIVVDNSSNDGSVPMIENDFKWVKLIKTDNYGLAHGCNIGAMISNGDYLLFLGEDGFPRENTIPGLIDYMDNHHEVGLATAKLVLRDGSCDLDVHRRFPTPANAFCRLFYLSKLFPKSKLFNSYFMIDQDHTKEHEIEMCITHFMFIPKHVFNEVKGFDDDNYFVYGEDADICYSIKQLGYKLMYLPQFEAGHYKGASFGTRKETKDISIKSLAWKNFMHFNSTRSQRVFIKNYLYKRYPFYFVWVMLFATYVLQYQREFNETILHLKKYGFKALNDSYTKHSIGLLKERFGF